MKGQDMTKEDNKRKDMRRDKTMRGIYEENRSKNIYGNTFDSIHINQTNQSDSEVKMKYVRSFIPT